LTNEKITKKKTKKESIREGRWTKIGVVITAVSAYLGLASQTHWFPFETVKASASNASPDTRSPAAPSFFITSASTSPGNSDNPTAYFKSPKTGAMIGLCFTATGASANIPANKERYSKLSRWSAFRAEYNILINFMTHRIRYL
jgi:hypothetical protein